MRSYSVYLIKGSNLEQAQQVFGSAEIVDGSEWMRCRFTKDDEPPEDEVLFGEESLTQAKSEILGEVVFVFGDTSVDGFVYEHSKGGEIVRKLVWFPMLDDDWNSGWICVEGEPEIWEESLFRKDKLEQFLAIERDRFTEEMEAEYQEYAERVREDWAIKNIEKGHTYPECDGTAILLVERYYGVERQA
ncbi:MAG: hypothetical protein K1X72_16800 [Pyrinomonadaceae bacterium]|nr:hypothetical protein [Pyrinomonadaceae bacterium]